MAAPAERPAVAEFFQLFKTPWEFLDPHGRYDVVLASAGRVPPTSARLLLVHGAVKSDDDFAHQTSVQPLARGGELRWGTRRIPIYGLLATCSGDGQSLATDARSAPVAVAQNQGQIRVRVGFNLWAEIETLLEKGQPVEHAAIPSLDLHIAFLRELILNAGLPVIEIPPVPAGHRFVSCLTHDVDHPILRPHRFDHTLAGFVCRGLLDTPWAAARGRVPARNILRNYAAILKLPLLHTGLIKDYWLEFERYGEIERGLGSTFFIIPHPKKPGRALKGSGPAPAKRAASYSVDDIRLQLDRLHANGCEIALHGIDAWADEAQAREEQAAISWPTTTGEIGVRMHWLYFDGQSPTRLEAAGFTYDSTVGYNSTVGYRAGTAQPYRPLTTNRLLELPMHIMDTAVFYPSYLNFTAREAEHAVAPLIDHACEAGGTITINWHDRSLLPERLWDTFYFGLIRSLQQRGAWFTTAGGAVAWFRSRRAITFQMSATGEIQAIASSHREDQPPLQLRRHEPRNGLLRPRAELDSIGEFRDRPLSATPVTVHSS